jgi:hypothetical protein
MNVQDMYVYTIEDIGLKELRSLYGDHRKLAYWLSCFDKEITQKECSGTNFEKVFQFSSCLYLVLISLAATINSLLSPIRFPPLN